MKIEEFLVEKDQEKERVDVLICKKFPNYSRSYIQKLFLQKNIFINDKATTKNRKVKLNDCVKIIFPDPLKFEVIKENIPLDIVYEDEDILIVNKKRGVVVHPAPGHYSKTLVNALMWHCENKLSSIGGVLRPGIVHRIDKNTSGLLAVAKTDDAFKSLCSQIKKHSFNRVYVALVHGKFKEKKSIINLPIGRNVKNRKKMAINYTNGKEAITEYEVLKEFEHFSYIKLKLKTGRTHQIRVHMSHLNHPIAGDETYGVKSDFKKYNLEKGQCLHAKELGFFHHKLEKFINFEAEPDEYFLNFLNRCENKF